MRKILFFIFAIHSLFAEFYAGVEGGYMRNFGVFDIYQNNLTPLDLKKQEFRENGIVGNVVLGTEHFFFNNYLGIRWGLFGGYGKTWGKNETYGDISTSTLSVGINTDAIINFIAKENLTAGFIIGVEYSYNTFESSKKIDYGASFSTSFPIYAPNSLQIIYVSNNTNDCYVNNQANYWIPALRAGASVLLNKHHRIEFFVKIPLKIFSNSNSYAFEYDNAFWKPSYQKIDTKVSYTHSSLQALISYKFVY